MRPRPARGWLRTARVTACRPCRRGPSGPRPPRRVARPPRAAGGVGRVTVPPAGRSVLPAGTAN